MRAVLIGLSLGVAAAVLRAIIVPLLPVWVRCLVKHQRHALPLQVVKDGPLHRWCGRCGKVLEEIARPV